LILPCHRRRALALAALASLLQAALLCGEARALRVGIFPAAPLVIEKKGKPAGLFIDLIDYFAGKSGWKVEYVAGTWAEALSRLEAGQVDLLPAVGYTADRARRFDFSKNPVYIDSGVLFASPKFAIHSIFDLQGRRVAALEGSIFTKGFLDYIASFGVSCNILYTEDNAAVMRAITRDEADAGVCIYSLGNELAKEYRVAVTPISFSPIALEFAVARGRNADLIAAADRLMAPMVGDPNSFFSQAYRRWITPPSPASIPSWLIWGLLGLLALGLLLGLWTFLLRRQVRQKTRHLEVEIAERRNAEERTAKSLRENETLLRELYHRTKNTMQVVRSILALQAIKYPENGELQRVARNTDESIQSIALVHEMLCKSRDLSRISIKEYIEELARLIFMGFDARDGMVSLSSSIEDGFILIDTALPFGLVLNELIVNSLEHAFPEGRRGTISISLSREESGSIVLRYQDDGVGFPEGFDFREGDSFGLELIRSVGEQQMMGKVAFSSRPGMGCVVEIPTDLYYPRV
jgi:two-component sensor histidine kinase/ABC-type amino acid transport substrate-binding protein